jgi:hypothetical protein
MNKKFNVEEQYKLYINRVGLKLEQMPPDQIRETRRAFFGACGQILILMRDDVGALPEKQAIKIMENMLQEVGNFWLVQGQRQN